MCGKKHADKLFFALVSFHALCVHVYGCEAEEKKPRISWLPYEVELLFIRWPVLYSTCL